MNKKFVLGILTAVAVAISSVAYAAPIDTISENMDTQALTINGSGLGANESAVIQVVNEGKTDFKIGDIELIYYVKADKDGKYTVSAGLLDTASTGAKSFMIKSNSMSKPFVYEGYQYFGADTVSVLVSGLSNALAAEDKDDKVDGIYTLINTEEENKNNAIIALGSEKLYNIYKKYSEKDIKAVIETTVKAVSSVSAISDYSEELVPAFILYAINNSKDEDVANEIIADYPEYIGVDSKTIYNELYLGHSTETDGISLSTEELNAVRKNTASDLYKIVNGGVSGASLMAVNAMSEEEVAQLVGEQIMVNAVKSVKNYLVADKIIKKYNADYLGTSMTKYNSVGNKSKLIENLKKRTFTTAEEMKEELEDCIKKMPSNPGGGGGGGVYSPANGTIKYEDPQNDVPLNYVEDILFTDLDGFDWAEEAINKLYKKGIVQGRDEKIFAPEGNVLREEFVKMLSETFGLTSDTAASSFEDVPEDVWFYKYVSSAYQSDIVKGHSQEIFGAGEVISRQDMAVMCYKAMIKKNDKCFADINSTMDFNDSLDVADYAVHAVEKLSGAGIIKGMEDNTFAPNENVTRAQAAVIIERIINFLNL